MQQHLQLKGQDTTHGDALAKASAETMYEKPIIKQGDLSPLRGKRRASIDCPNSGALLPAQSETKIPLIVKVRSAANQGCIVIAVPRTWTQQELENHIRFLYGYSSTETLAVTLGGKQLREPHARLCDGKVSHYGLLQHESVSLLGGSKKVEEDKQEQVELPPIMQVLRHGLLNLNMYRQEEEQEGDQDEEQKDDNSEMDFIATLVDVKTKSGKETKPSKETMPRKETMTI